MTSIQNKAEIFEKDSKDSSRFNHIVYEIQGFLWTPQNK